MTAHSLHIDDLSKHKPTIGNFKNHWKGPQLISTKVLQLRLHQLKVQNAFHINQLFLGPPSYLIPVKSPTEDQLASCLKTKSTRTKYSKKIKSGRGKANQKECRSSLALVPGWLKEPNQCDAGRENKPAPGAGSRCPWSQEASKSQVQAEDSVCKVTQRARRSRAGRTAVASNRRSGLRRRPGSPRRPTRVP